MVANITGSHVVYKRKIDGSAKVRIVLWGHHDKGKDYLRVDAPSVSFEIFRLIISLCAAFVGVVGQMDVKAAFLQVRGFDRLLYVRIICITQGRCAKDPAPRVVCDVRSQSCDDGNVTFLYFAFR